MSIKKTRCETYVKDKLGNKITKLKKKYVSLKEAERQSDLFNIRITSKVKMKAYECPICDHYHIGRTWDELTSQDIEYTMDKLTPNKYKTPTGLRIIGSIDITKFKDDPNRISNRTSYHKNGSPKTIIPMTGKSKDGLSISYNSKGVVKKKVNYKNNIKRGIEIQYGFVEDVRQIKLFVINVDNKVFMNLKGLVYSDVKLKPYVFKP
jgi:hypothetical protein